MNKMMTSRMMCRPRTSWLALSFTLVFLTVTATRSSTHAQERDFRGLMTKGKLEADLGNYDSASEAFESIASDETAPVALRWEAMVRNGLARGAAGDTRESREAFKAVREKYSEEPEAMSFLTDAVTGNHNGKVWVDFKSEFEELLKSAEVVSTEAIRLGDDRPEIVYLERSAIEIKAIWRPTQLQSSPVERYQFEVAAYELDKILELDMVPPTVERNIEGRQGALQLWVHGCKLYREVESRASEIPEWNRELSRAKTFDILIGNRDRTSSNILVDPAWGIVLIDHSRSFLGVKELDDPPLKFDRPLIDKLRGLSKIGLQLRLEDILAEKEIESILKRRDQLLTFLEDLIARDGESAVFF